MNRAFVVSALLLLITACDKKSEATLNEARQDARELGDTAKARAEQVSAVAKAKLEAAGEKLEAAGDKLSATGQDLGDKAGRAAEYVETKVVEAGARMDALKADLAGPELKASFLTPSGVALRGDVVLAQRSEGVHVSVDVEHAPPGQLAVHIHQTSNCSDIPNKSMGAHFAPEGHKHGLPSATEHHLGDLGNMAVDAKGEGELDIVVPKATLKAGDARSFAGRSVVIHQGVDDGTGESGNAGAPIACAPLPQGS